VRPQDDLLGTGGDSARNARLQAEFDQARRIFEQEQELARQRQEKEREEFDMHRELQDLRAEQDLERRQKELEDERAAEEERKRIQESAAQREELLAQQREERLNTLSSVTEASTQLITKVADVALTIAGKSERAQKIVNAIIGTATIAREGVAAAVEIARAASSAASNDVSGAVLHALAAGLHIAAAAKAAADLGGKKKGSTSGGSGGVNRPEMTASRPGPSREETSITIVNHGPITSREVQDDLNAAARNSSRRAA
jgi:hypothetical protein